jgi:ATP phosphoribosyltransferase
MSTPLIFAIPKGRILDEALPLLQAAGIDPSAEFFNEKSRALIFETNRPDMAIIRVRAFDVATFVAHGAAHIGIVGSDVVDEFDFSELYAPVDLGIGRCRLSLASPKGAPALDLSASHARIATKYPATTRAWLAARGIQAECIKLNGAMEIAPLLGLAPHIVDLVSTGKTLVENNLEEREVLSEVSARLIVNRAAFKLNPNIPQLVEAFRSAASAS